MARVDDYEPLDIDLGFPVLEDQAVSRQRPARAPRTAPNPKTWVYILRWVIVIAVLGAIFGVGAALGSCSSRRVARDLRLDIASLETSAGVNRQSATFWESEATSATAVLGAVESDLASMSAECALWKARSEDASATIATIQQQKAIKAAPAPRPTQVSYESSYNTSGVEQWRALVDEYFPDENVDAALSVMRKESGGNPNATGPLMRDGYRCSGLLQQHPKYWPGRLAAAEAIYGDLPDSIFDPRANIAVSAYLSNGGRSWSHWSAKS